MSPVGPVCSEFATSASTLAAPGGVTVRQLHRRPFSPCWGDPTSPHVKVLLCPRRVAPVPLPSAEMPAPTEQRVYPTWGGNGSFSSLLKFFKLNLMMPVISARELWSVSLWVDQGLAAAVFLVPA